MSSNDDHAQAIPDYLVPLIRPRGRSEIQRGTLRLTTLQTGPRTVTHWTPFNDLASDEPFSPVYRHALERQQVGSVLPYGIEVWHGENKVLCMLWADDGTSEVISFDVVPGRTKRSGYDKSEVHSAVA